MSDDFFKRLTQATDAAIDEAAKALAADSGLSESYAATVIRSRIYGAWMEAHRG